MRMTKNYYERIHYGENDERKLLMPNGAMGTIVGFRENHEGVFAVEVAFDPVDDREVRASAVRRARDSVRPAVPRAGARDPPGPPDPVPGMQQRSAAVGRCDVNV